MSFVSVIEELKLRDRLDKLDGSISGIVASIQAINSRLDTVETNIKEKINFNEQRIKHEVRKAKDTINSDINAIENSLTKEIHTVKEDIIEESYNKHKTLFMLLIGLVILSMIVNVGITFFM